MKAFYLALSVVSAAAFPAVAGAQTWYGSEIAATADPIRTVDVNGDRVRDRDRDRSDRYDRRYRPQRYLYVDALGRTTVWVGVPPDWLLWQLSQNRARELSPREYPISPSQRKPADACAKGIGGAASASAAIGAAASVNGRSC